MCAQNLVACTTSLQGPWGTSLASRSTSAENTARRSGNVTSAPRSMLFNQTGKLTPRPVALESTDVTVEPSSQGN